MRILLLLLLPFMSIAQLPLSITETYHVKELSSIIYKTGDTSTKSWKRDTIKYITPAEIKFTPSKISIDGHGSYLVKSHTMNSATSDFYGYHYYELTNGAFLSYVEDWIYLVYPIVNHKQNVLSFQIDKKSVNASY